MAHIVDDRVQETTTSTGTGDLVLAGASSKCFSFADAGFVDGDTFWGLIVNLTSNEVELAFCTYNAGGSISRATPRNGNDPTDFSQGTKTVSVVAVANNENRSYRMITSGASYAMAYNDSVVRVNKTIGSATAITLKANPAIGDRVTIIDGKGDAGINPITITPASGLVNGAANVVMNTDRVTFDLIYTGSEWSTLSVL